MLGYTFRCDKSTVAILPLQYQIAPTDLTPSLINAIGTDEGMEIHAAQLLSNRVVVGSACKPHGRFQNFPGAIAYHSVYARIGAVPLLVSVSEIFRAGLA